MDSGGEGRKERLVRKGKGREEGGVWKVEERSENRDREVKGNVKGAAKKEGGGRQIEETYRRLYVSLQ